MLGGLGCVIFHVMRIKLGWYPVPCVARVRLEWSPVLRGFGCGSDVLYCEG